MRTLLLSILILSLASCTKSVLVFVKVKVIQSGEYIEVYGFLEAPQSEPHAYVIQALMCDTIKEFKVIVPAGETEGWADFQDNCKIIGWKIVYDDILRQ